MKPKTKPKAKRNTYFRRGKTSTILRAINKRITGMRGKQVALTERLQKVEAEIQKQIDQIEMDIESLQDSKTYIV